jgi:hypothetical protein
MLRSQSGLPGDLDETVNTVDLRQAFEKFGPIVEDQTYVRGGKFGEFCMRCMYNEGHLLCSGMSGNMYTG